jgi:DNA recombination protein RmuC
MRLSPIGVCRASRGSWEGKMTIETAFISALMLVILWLAWRIGRLGRALESGAGPAPASLQLLQREVEAVRSGVDDRLREHLEQSRELSLRIGHLAKATENVEQLGVGIGELQRLLQPPQLRGAFGERLLEELLADALPRQHYKTQYCYPSSGVRVDAALLLGEGRVLPIDSKFPLDNFRRWVELRSTGDGEADACRRAFARDVMRHVDDIAGKYLVPEDGALDVAFMYIPSESVFHEIAVGGLEGNGASLAEYAQRRQVVPVSPNTLHAYLTVVRMGLRGFQLQQHAREMLASLTHLQGDVESMRSVLETAIKQARYSIGNLEEAEGALSRVEGRLEALSRVREGGISGS